MMRDIIIFSSLGICLVIWLVKAYKRNRLEVRKFKPHESSGGNSNTAPANTFTLTYSAGRMYESPTPKMPSYDQFEEGKSYTTRGGESVETDAVFDAWTSGDLNAMVAVLGLRTHPVDRHHLLNCLVEAAQSSRQYCHA